VAELAMKAEKTLVELPQVNQYGNSIYEIMLEEHLWMQFIRYCLRADKGK